MTEPATDGRGSVGHTAGPWSVPHFARDDHSCGCGYVLSEHQHGMGAIATVHVSEEGADWRDGDHEPPAIAKANARLISAAPDLLAACLALVQYDERDDSGPNAGIQMMVDYDEALTLARAAIARATGASA